MRCNSGRMTSCKKEEKGSRGAGSWFSVAAIGWSEIVVWGRIDCNRSRRGWGFYRHHRALGSGESC